MAEWLLSGAPAGLACNTAALDGVCPCVDNTREADIEDLAADYSKFTNYTEVEENQEAFAAL